MMNNGIRKNWTAQIECKKFVKPLFIRSHKIKLIKIQKKKTKEHWIRENKRTNNKLRKKNFTGVDMILKLFIFIKDLYTYTVLNIRVTFTSIACVCVCVCNARISFFFFFYLMSDCSVGSVLYRKNLLEIV